MAAEPSREQRVTKREMLRLLLNNNGWSKTSPTVAGHASRIPQPMVGWPKKKWKKKVDERSGTVHVAISEYNTKNTETKD